MSKPDPLMNEQTIATLAELREARWFSKIGIVDTKVADVLENWEQAMESCSSLTWQNLLLEAANQYRRRLLEKSVERYRLWSNVLEITKPHALSLVMEKLMEIPELKNLPKIFSHTVEWDMIHLLMESEFADVFPPGFFASQAYWYVKGHFPCGWKGNFPEGRLIIF
jgi:hypothetical protein